jgi:periplasmic protein TonB
MRQKVTTRKKLISIFALVLTLGNMAFSQGNHLLNKERKKPSFPYGEDSLQRFIHSNLKWTDNQFSGKGYVVISFIVDRKGNMLNPIVSKSLVKALDREALRVVKLMPKWIPARKNNKNFSSKLALPIKFEITE